MYLSTHGGKIKFEFGRPAQRCLDSQKSNLIFPHHMYSSLQSRLSYNNKHLWKRFFQCLLLCHLTPFDWNFLQIGTHRAKDLRKKSIKITKRRIDPCPAHTARNKGSFTTMVLWTAQRFLSSTVYWDGGGHRFAKNRNLILMIIIFFVCFHSFNGHGYLDNPLFDYGLYLVCRNWFIR